MMAEHFNYSRDYFRKAFQDDFGMGLSAYISQRKIQKAARELRQGVKVASLAKKYGFKSRNGFDKAFRKAFCTSPSKYVLGPVVNNFTNVPDDAVKIEIAAGRFAVFETDRESDVDNLADTIRMFSRCVFYGWIK